MPNSTTTDPVTYLPYGRQEISDEDIQAVVDALKSEFLTQGPAIKYFERALARCVGADHAVACANGTAALHLAVMALGLGPGDAVLTSANTFLADANCARYVGADVAFADIDPFTGLIDVESVDRQLADDSGHHIKVVIPVHFAGQPADLVTIHEMAEKHGAAVVDDACHAIGSTYDHGSDCITIGGSPHSDMTVFSFHPVKHVAMGEGGAVTTSDPELATRLQRFRNHGTQREAFQNTDMALAPDGQPNPWYYEMQEPGYNYRLTDIQAALGTSQLSRLPNSVHRRNQIAGLYQALLAERFDDDRVRPLRVVPGVTHAYHLFVVLIQFGAYGISRADVMSRLRRAGIGTQVHYIPIPLQPYYRRYCGSGPGDFPGAEEYYDQALSLPMYPGLTDMDVERVVDTLHAVLTGRP